MQLIIIENAFKPTRTLGKHQNTQPLDCIVEILVKQAFNELQIHVSGQVF